MTATAVAQVRAEELLNPLPVGTRPSTMIFSPNASGRAFPDSPRKSKTPLYPHMQ